MNLNDETFVCAICMQNIKSYNLFTTPCNHSFCINCICKWTGIIQGGNLKHNHNCPLCRNNFDSNLITTLEINFINLFFRNKRIL